MKADKQRMDKVANMGCIVCKIQFDVMCPANIHHLTGLKFRSMGKKAKDYIPLCYHHHQGIKGIHTLGTKAWEREFGLQEDLLEIINEQISQ